MNNIDVLGSIFVGFFATFFMDITNKFLSSYKIVKLGSPNLLGRLTQGWVKGQFVYNHISSIKKVPHEYLKGLLVHYVIGGILSFLFLFITLKINIKIYIIPYSIFYGILTTVFPWFFLFPSIGYGIMGLKAPKKNKMFQTSFINHLNYGIGLALGFSLLTYIKHFLI